MTSENEIHPLSLINPEAKIGKGVKIGPYCIIGPNVEIGDNSILHSHVVMDGHTRIGKKNTFFQFSSIGAPPQDLTYKGEPTRVEIGDDNVFREYVSIHRGTLKQNSLTKIGNRCLFMAYAHIGHDVSIGDNVIIVNAVNLAGHVTIGDRCIISGGCNVGQFITLGKGSYIGGASAVDRDIPHYCTAVGNRVKMKGINIIGMRRLGFSKPVISEVIDFYRSMEASGLSPRSFIEHKEFFDEYRENEVILEISEFIRKSEIGIAPFMG